MIARIRAAAAAYRRRRDYNPADLDDARPFDELHAEHAAAHPDLPPRTTWFALTGHEQARRRRPWST